MASTMKRVSIKRQLQQFSVQDKLDAIQRVNEGESKASVARDIGVPESTLRGWCKSEDKLRYSSTEEENQGGMIGDGLTGLCNGTLDVVAPSTKRARSGTETGVAKDPELDEAVWYWIRQQHQHVTSLSEQLLCQQMTQPVKTSSAVTSPVSTGAMFANNALDLNPSTGWFWRWYKRFGMNVPNTQIPEGKAKTTDVPLLTTTRATPVAVAPTQIMMRSPAPAHTPAHAHTPAPAHLPAPAHHNPMPAMSSNHPAPMALTTNNVVAAAVTVPEEPSDDEDDEPPLTAADAVVHGEKFLRWLDCCSDPSVTALQILQFRYLLNNVRACAARRAKAATSRDKS